MNLYLGGCYFVDDITLVDKTRESLSMKLDNWKKAFHKQGFKFSHTKTKYLIRFTTLALFKDSEGYKFQIMKHFDISDVQYKEVRKLKKMQIIEPN